MLRDNLVELIEPMLNSAGANPLALTHHQIQASGDRLPCLENPRPKGAESSLTENVTSPFQAEPPHLVLLCAAAVIVAYRMGHPSVGNKLENRFGFRFERGFHHQISARIPNRRRGIVA